MLNKVTVGLYDKRTYTDETVQQSSYVNLTKSDLHCKVENKFQ